MSEYFVTELAKSARQVEERLEAILPNEPGNRLHAAMRYACFAPGKRLRPFFVRESARLHGVTQSRALDVAASLEMIHCYSLVHDDLPAMDNDDLRRGLPTTHRKFDEATAILAGDGLLTFAFQHVALVGETPALIAALALAAGPQGMVAGQMRDIEAETAGFKSLAEISNMQSLKTGALFEFACCAGPIMAGHDQTTLQTYAQNIGLAFQIADDILDVESNATTLGKATQKDKAKGKSTFVDFLGLPEAKREAKRLVQAAKAALQIYGDEAKVLCAAADFMIARQK